MPIAKPVKKPPSKTKGGFNIAPLISAILLASARLLSQNKKMDALKASKTKKSPKSSPKTPKSPKSSPKIPK
jgi:hypothetical protein